ncbi:hypothetical protein L0657_20215 [Dyadobacter sp. CY345]|uniref:hypothetical protein n=1 Tax=Dyadobacter sp. CY345 TaxID=2909335 RepID=UPI001F2266EC|nr:hypothetical protein [Dyadobacter sp. CY345]MCF2446294.1 hypothetical protein [Dyadobacter sp. CY345]
MKIKLQRVGGILPMTKEAAIEVDWTDEEIKKLLDCICLKEKKDSKIRDATAHFLEVKGKATPIDLKKIPLEYKAIFEGLEADMKFVKS